MKWEAEMIAAWHDAIGWSFAEFVDQIEIGRS
jgi:hypothetical protein